MPLRNKKRKESPLDGSSASNGKKKSIIESETGVEFRTYTLDEIREKLLDLCKRLPTVPEDVFGYSRESDTVDKKRIKEWAQTFQSVTEEFNLLSYCVGTATYKWGTDRSGAADQNLNLLIAEFSTSQDQISSAVSSRLSNVLAPVVDLVVERVVVTKGPEGQETRQNEYVRKSDDEFVMLCNVILARNSKMIRQLVLSHFDKVLRCISDYQHAQKNDSQSDRGFAY